MKNRLKELRENKKLSQTEFAKAFNSFLNENQFVKDSNGKTKNISYATVSRWENNRTPIPSIYYSSLAEFFKVSVSYLQGLTISESDVLRIINDSYLSDVQQFLASQNESKSFDYASFIKSDDIYFGVSRSVDMYLLINKIPLPLNSFSMLQLKKYSKDVEAYWKKNFNFIFNDIVGVDVNRYPSLDFTNDFRIKMSEINTLIPEIELCISTKYLETYNTSISKYYEAQNYYHDIAEFQSNTDEIMRFNSKNKIKMQITKIINELSSFSAKLDKLPDNPQFIIDKLVKLNGTIKNR